MAIIDGTTILAFGHYPTEVAVTANQWRVVRLHQRCKSVTIFGVEDDKPFGAFLFTVVDTDGPDDGDVSSGAGDYDLSDVQQFDGAADPGGRQYPAIPVSTPPKSNQQLLLAISSASSASFFVTQYGS